MSVFNLKTLQKIAEDDAALHCLKHHKIIGKKKFLEALSYARELNELQSEMFYFQKFIRENKKKLILIYEGRDAAGKGGAIERAIPKLNPKYYRIAALPVPSPDQLKQWFFQRYVEHLPMEEEIVFFDRSWYNRAVVEPIFGFCTPQQYESFMRQVNPFENTLAEDGFIIIKFYLNISREEQQKRFDRREANPLKRGKMGGLDKNAQEKWEEYNHYIERMLRTTSTKKLPWVVIDTDDKKTARLETLKYILSSVEGFKSKLDLTPNAEVVKIYRNPE